LLNVSAFNSFIAEGGNKQRACTYYMNIEYKFLWNICCICDCDMANIL